MSELVLRPSDVPANFQHQMQMADAYARSSLLPGHLRGKPENVLVILGAARALDIPAFWAFQSLFVVSGKLGMEASLMRALVIRAGHQFETRKMTRDEAIVAIKRSDKSSWFEVSFDATDAKTAKLSGDNWTKYPRSMLHARATVMAIRAECPEVLYGIMYTPEELGAKVDDDGHPVLDGASGQIIMDSTAEEVVVDDEMLRKIALAIRGGTMEEAANAFLLASRLNSANAEHMQVPILTMWCNRMKELVADSQSTEDDLRALWRYARGTELLGLVIDQDGTSLEEAIRSRIERMKLDETAATEVVVEVVDESTAS